MEKKKIDYQKILDGILSGIAASEKSAAESKARETGGGAVSACRKPSLLLHACCAPCSSYVIEYLSEYFDITVLYYNPNIYPPEEYRRRLSELQKFLPQFPAAFQNNVKLAVHDYNPQEYYNAVKTEEEPMLAEEAERGERCRRCYYFRMKHAYEYAAAEKFNWFTTTLSISPFKDADKINAIGKNLEQPDGPLFLTSDFKKRSGFLRSLQLSKEYGLYRQQYCGCIYSKINTENSRTHS